MRRLLIPALVVLAVAGAIVFEVATGGSSNETGKVPPPLPSAVLQAPKTTLVDLRGKPALINFWASWCEPCRQEAPELERLYRSLHGTARLVGVDYTDQNGAARSFIRQYGWSFPLLSDPNGVYGARYGFRGLPATIVLDARGRVVETLLGPQTGADFRQALDAARGT